MGSAGRFSGNPCVAEFTRNLLWIVGAVRASQGRGHFTVGVLPPGIYSVTFGLQTQGFALERMHFEEFQDTCSSERIHFESVLL